MEDKDGTFQKKLDSSYVFAILVFLYLFEFVCMQMAGPNK